MSNVVRALLLSLLLCVSFGAQAQTPSEEVVRSFLQEKLMPLLTRNLEEYSTERGESDDARQLTAEQMSTELANCLIQQLELIALHNHIDRAVFMDSLAFSIQWKSDDKFISQLENSGELGRGAEQCIRSVLELHGVPLK